MVLKEVKSRWSRAYTHTCVCGSQAEQIRGSIPYSLNRKSGVYHMHNRKTQLKRRRKSQLYWQGVFDYIIEKVPGGALLRLCLRFRIRIQDEEDDV
jgi:hypothetical protein